MKVMKFGGGCLRDKEGFERVLKVIKEDPEPKAVVISAIYGVTDRLETTLDNMHDNESIVPDTINTIKELHETLLLKLVDDTEIRTDASSRLLTKIQKLERLLYGVLYTEELTERTKAMILSFGEKLAVICLEAVLKVNGVKASAMESEDIAFITDQCFDNATADLNWVRRNVEFNIKPIMDDGIVPIITGYYGCTPEKHITSFGRNGTDYSAAVLASALGADELEIWKDVLGFMSADPSLVPDAKHVESLSYYEAAELSYFGAKILHPRTVEPLIETKPIPIKILNILDPESKPTVISHKGFEDVDIVKSVTFNPHIRVLKILGPGVGYKPGIISLLGQELSDSGINIVSIITSQTCINLLIEDRDAHKAFEHVNKLSGGVIEKVVLVDNIALIGVVGEGLVKQKGLAARVFSAVAKENINVEMISAGASQVAYYFIVNKDDLQKAIKAVHDDYFKTS